MAFNRRAPIRVAHRRFPLGSLSPSRPYPVRGDNDPPPRTGWGGIDLDRVRQERHQFDVGGHYARPDAFILKDNIRAQGLVNFQP